MDAELFWKKVKLLLSEQDKNQEWLCEQTGLILGSLRNKISLGRLPGFDEGLKIVESLGLTMEQFKLYPDVPSKDIINIPVYEQAFSAGKGQELPDTAEIMDYVALPANLKKYRNNIRASYVRGDSMEPTLFDNDIILYDTFGYDGTDGIYAINYKGAAFVKRLQRDKDFVRIISDNKMYAPMTESGESDDFRIVGKVRYVVHKLQG
ncbi:MAG: helix-turn-helix transcriptional regulator [Spirochaetaceae bacterium]|nr:helix-turn-helix transcriptional regulator [Spirochaetaceae bacterium]MBP5793813.1 helix-turn-helix transcriptional regulator [Spirochaetaceae bacterium]